MPNTVVQVYSSLEAEYSALRRGAVVIDRSERVRLRLAGPKAAEMMAGLVTNDTQSLQAGQGQYAAALTPKGKIVADVRLFVTEGSVLSDTGARAGDAWRAMVRKYVNPRVAPYTDETSSTRTLGVYGPTAHHVVEAMAGINSSALAVLPAYSHISVDVDASPWLVARTPDAGTGGFELFLPAAAFDAAWERATRAGAVPCGLLAWEAARVEAGRPEWGLDMDETTLVQEANLDELQAVSYTKGCYVGQEVVARVHFKGHVNRNLRGLRATGSMAPQFASTLHDASGKAVGDVRTCVVSPRLGAIALGMVRREVEPGAVLTARWDGGEATLEVAPLPFPAP
ncbi:MAG TPA: hypothetical protein VFK16_01300 [Gemmatimonadaceae bacterium]|nr:hypothetical protein [Gemmatimonadaceae bacterium]